MNISKNMLRLYAVSDRSWLKDNKDLRDILPLLFENGVTLFQLREKHLAREAFIKEALELKEICRRYHIPLIINDAVDIAKEIGADGVHVGLSDMDIKKAREILGSGAIIGASAHNTAEALAAQAAGADYIGCGAVFKTGTKTDVTALSHSELQYHMQSSPDSGSCNRRYHRGKPASVKWQRDSRSRRNQRSLRTG